MPDPKRGFWIALLVAGVIMVPLWLWLLWWLGWWMTAAVAAVCTGLLFLVLR